MLLVPFTDFHNRIIFYPLLLCSWDTNWTLNAVLVKKSTMLSKTYPVSPVEFKSIAYIGLSQWEKQVFDAFISNFDRTCLLSIFRMALNQ